MSKFIPILFSTPMVQAILEGRKSMTRRVMKPQPHESITNIKFGYSALTPDGCIELRGKFIVDGEERSGSKFFKCPYGEIRDVLWVRETFMNLINSEFGEYGYKADLKDNADKLKWKPSIFMPKEACRIFLKITNVRVERLKDISREDASKEGVCISNKQQRFKGYQEHRWPEENFATLWELLNGDHSWEANPFVWVIEFKRVEKPVNFN